MTMWNGLGLVFCGLIAVLILRESRREFVPYILLTLCITIWLTLLPTFTATADWFRTMTGDLGIVLLKALGISLLTELGCEICRSVGEGSIAGYVSLVGKGELFLMTLPLLQEFIRLSMEFAV